jgi:hypothetical protein
MSDFWYLATPYSKYPKGLEAALARVEREKQEAIANAERDRLAAIERERVIKERERLSAEQAEAAKEAAARQAERDRVAAVEAERAKVAREAAAQKAEDDRRAADKAHRAKINREVLSDLLAVMEPLDIAMDDGADIGTPIMRAVVEAIARGKVRHVGIRY